MRRHLLVLTVLLGVMPAAAQTANLAENFSAERFRLAFTKSGLLDVEAGSVKDGFSWDLGFALQYAHDPLVVYRLSDNKQVGSLVQDRLGGHLIGAIGFGKLGPVGLQLGLEVPMVFVNARPSSIPDITLAPLRDITGVGLGDLRLAPKIAFLNHADHFVDMAFTLGFLLPTGGATRYLGSTGVTIAPELAVTKPIDNIKLGVNVAANFRTAEQVVVLNQRVDNNLNVRFGAAYRFNQVDPTKLPLELGVTGDWGFSLERPLARANQNQLEGKLYGAYDFTSWAQIFAGVGKGFVAGYGTPDWRVFLGARFSAPAPEAVVEKKVEPVVAAIVDTDGDGLLDNVDKCPTKAEDKDKFEDEDGCPDPDNDKDGVLDVDDKCVLVPGVKENDGCPDVDTDGDGIVDRLDKCVNDAEDKDSFEDEDGCPDPDNDKDGVLDVNDKCVLEPGVVDNKGCPDTDRDGDTIVDRLDNCPDEKGIAKNSGCKDKQLATLESGRIVIIDQVYFKLNKAIIETRSYPLLDNVAKVLKAHPEIEQMRVEGHTDSQGDDASNMKLSQGRADAVRDYLVKKGIDDKRLVAIGYGETKPIADNKNVAGRAKNRRVEFNIVGGAPGVQKTDSGPSQDTFEKKK